MALARRARPKTCGGGHTFIRAVTGYSSGMTRITADDIRVLAQSTSDDPVLAMVDDTVVVLARSEVPPDAQVIFSAAELNRELGPDVTDAEAEVLAGSLTNRLAR